MSSLNRVLLALAIIVVDLLVFAIPLTAFVVGYIIIAKPLWAKRFIEKVYED